VLQLNRRVGTLIPAILTSISIGLTLIVMFTLETVVIALTVQPTFTSMDAHMTPGQTVNGIQATT
jgi:hypothetical protein